MDPSDVAPSEEILVLQHVSPEDFLAVAYPTLREDENTANIVLAHALARASTDFHSFWLTVLTRPSNSAPILDMVLSCLDSPLGNYPIFLWARNGCLAQDTFQHRIHKLALCLRTCVAPERVFSVFGPANPTNTFAKIWSTLTGFKIAPEPLYTAFFASCNLKRLKLKSAASPDQARKASISDLDGAAVLCEEFFNSSPYRLDSNRAREYTQSLIQKGQLWLIEKDGEIASICAVTRSSLRVSAITMVYTTRKHRCLGLARYLVQEVTRSLFRCGKESVVLYVGVDNNAQRVYERVGFEQGVLWEEIGFIGTHAGHW
ncbi:acyl-CoA N-acyltransferase [Roridomyces roridus]|uniref:Acyl-CoA N-acyltransferase n=1 Tax=Roridomyces roridus TaxID=1738132 RepID=A0AAD7BV73_9AGAR|nr:acyl-CoA N-acyltransferase [Roridomyces roridus]